MAPKKKEVVEEKPILGRFSSHLKVTIAHQLAPPPAVSSTRAGGRRWTAC